MQGRAATFADAPVPVSTNLKRDLFALGLLALVVFLGAALVTYDPADPVVEPVAPLNLLYQPDPLVTPANSQVHLLSHPGSWRMSRALLLPMRFGWSYAPARARYAVPLALCLAKSLCRLPCPRSAR